MKNIAALVLVLLLTVAAAACAPSAASDDSNEILVVFSGDVVGEYTTCGCKNNPAGGLSKRAAFIETQRRAHKDVLVFDLGNQFHAEPQIHDKLVDQETARARLFVRALNHMKTTAAVPGPLDFALGAGAFREFAADMQYPMLAANMTDAQTGKALFPAWRVVSAGGKKVGIVGVASPEFAWRGKEIAHDGVRIDPLKPAVERAVKDAKAEADIVIVLANVTNDELDDVAKAAKGASFIFAGAGARRFTRDVERREGIPVFQIPPRGREAGLVTLSVSGNDNNFEDRTEAAKIDQRLENYRAVLARMEQQAGEQGIDAYYKESPAAIDRYRDIKEKIADEEARREKLGGAGSWFEFRMVTLGRNVSDDMQIQGWTTKFEDDFGLSNVP
ncbi:hypothetical protein K8I61_20815 [bacterium]|nr:hypothetical protein [bacterium]